MMGSEKAMYFESSRKYDQPFCVSAYGKLSVLIAVPPIFLG
jgi:hypothetical protein